LCAALSSRWLLTDTSGDASANLRMPGCVAWLHCVDIRVVKAINGNDMTVGVLRGVDNSAYLELRQIPTDCHADEQLAGPG